MSTHSIRRTLKRRAGPVAVLGMILALSACGLDKKSIPDLSGPSTFAFSLVVTVNPDVLLADAVSTASVVATLRGPDGKPVGGRPIFFAVTDENFNFVDLGTLQSTIQTFANPGPQVTEVTQGNGIAQVIYRVPERISLTEIEKIHIIARLVGDDSGGQQYKNVEVELRPAEVRRFPPNADNTAPKCDFFIDPAVGPNGGAYPPGFVIRMKSTSSDGDVGGFIARYFWDFGDGNQDDGHPEVQHAFALPGTYTVTHVVTDNNGEQSDCTLDLQISN
jgi:PKD repeat protein